MTIGFEVPAQLLYRTPSQLNFLVVATLGLCLSLYASKLTYVYRVALEKEETKSSEG